MFAPANGSGRFSFVYDFVHDGGGERADASVFARTASLHDRANSILHFAASIYWESCILQDLFVGCIRCGCYVSAWI